MAKAPNVFPIVGGRKIEHLQGNIKALGIKLTDKQIEYLESIVPFEPGFPNNFVGAVSLGVLVVLLRYFANAASGPSRQWRAVGFVGSYCPNVLRSRTTGDWSRLECVSFLPSTWTLRSGAGSLSNFISLRSKVAVVCFKGDSRETMNKNNPEQEYKQNALPIN